jgi:transcriptional regulator with XRE-family HTH domain
VPTTKQPPAGLDQDAITALFKPDGRWPRERGACVRERRIELGLTKIELAERCQIREATVYRIETGAMVPSDRLRAVMAYALDTRPEDLWVFPPRLELEIVSRAGAAK